MNRADYVRELAPPSPPCFPTREQWVQYLESAAEVSASAGPGPVLMDRGQPVFNRAFNFCRDCSREHKQLMSRAARCKPQFLHEDNVLVAAPAPAVQPVVWVRRIVPAPVREPDMLLPAGLAGAMA